MKNLPDKIYLSFGEMPEERFEKEDYKEFCEYHNNLVAFYEQKFWETDVEYTRTDAFIKKAEKFLKSYRRETPDKTGYISGVVDDKMIVDFKKYMTGD